MHGLIMNQLRLFTQSTGQSGDWDRVCQLSGIPTGNYKLAENYADDQTFAVIGHLCEIRRISSQSLLEEFGEFIVPALIRIYGALLNPDWNILEILENTEAVIHCVVRARALGSSPPVLDTTRISETEVHVLYRSPRQLCALARGIIRGIAVQLGESVLIQDLKCMHLGDPECVISVRTTGATPG